MSLNGGEDTTALLCKWNHCDQEVKIHICEYQDNLMGEFLNLQYMIVRGGRDDKYRIGLEPYMRPSELQIKLLDRVIHGNYRINKV